MAKHSISNAIRTGMSDEVLADRLERAVRHNWSSLERDTLMLQAADRLRHYLSVRGRPSVAPMDAME
jgi:hypothetical protein